MVLNQDSVRWNEGKNPLKEKVSVTIQIPLYSQQMRLFTSSPEFEEGKVQPLEWKEVTGIRGPSAETAIFLGSITFLVGFSNKLI
jgi:hypothetical protein